MPDASRFGAQSLRFAEWEHRFLVVLARRLAPGAGPESPEGAAEFSSAVETAVSGKPASVLFLLGAFLFALRWGPVLLRGRPFERLSDQTQDRFLRALESAPWTVLRSGLWGARALVFAGCYGTSSAAARCGWRAPAGEGNPR